MHLALLALEIAFVASVILLLYQLRSRLGLAPLYIFVGSNQYMQTILAGTLYVPFVADTIVSPGSVVLFASSLFAVLLVYLRDGVPAARQLIYGIIGANVTLTILAAFASWHLELGGVSNLLGIPVDVFRVDIRVFLVGTGVLFADALLLVVLHETLLLRARRIPVPVRVIGALLFVLYFDAVLFTFGAFAGRADWVALAAANAAGKTLSGLEYGAILALYLHWQRSQRASGRSQAPQQWSDVFSILTYRERYERERQSGLIRAARLQKVTAQVRAELAFTEDRYRGLFDATSDGILVISPSDGRVVDANPAFAALSGRSADALRGGSIDGPPLFNRPLWPRFSEPTATKTFHIEDAELLRADGTSVPVEVRGSRFVASGGEVVHLNVRDATERRAAEAAASIALLGSEARYRRLVQLIPEAVLVLREGQIVFANEAAGRVLGGRSRSPLVEADMRALFGDLADEFLEGPPEPKATAELKVRHEGTITRLDGRDIDVEMAVAPVAYDLGAATLLVVRDVTQRRRLERLKDEFISTVSHELRTPLTSIKGAVDLVAGGVVGALDPRGTGLMTVAARNCDRLVALIDDLLDVQRLEFGKAEFHFEKVSLQDTVRDALKVNGPFAEQLEVALELEEEPATSVEVRVDPARLMQVLTNLLSNAIKFSPAGETVRVRIERRGVAVVRTTIEDHGPGIPEAFRAQVFQRFAQADTGDSRNSKGTGLGLAISRALMSRMGGVIGFETEEGRGTSFWFDLPTT